MEKLQTAIARAREKRSGDAPGPTAETPAERPVRNPQTAGKGRDNGNVYYAWPAWIPRIGVSVLQFPASIFQISLKNYEAYDAARLPFVIDAIASFRS